MKRAIILLMLLTVSALAVRAEDDVLIERDVEYGKAGTVSLKLDLYRPAEAPRTPAPAIVFLHGGGWQSGSKANPPGGAAVARRGYVYASVDYRLSGVAAYPAALDDAKAAIAFLRENAKRYGLDPARIGVWGSSAGAHLALQVACVDSSALHVKACCSWFGPTDFTQPDRLDKRRLGLLRPFLGGTPEEKPEAYREASPIVHVTKDAPPTLFVHGESDNQVPIAESEKMLLVLKAAGVEATLVRVKNAGHGFAADKGKKIEPTKDKILAETLEFFDRHLKGK
jgi:acetyl esterase/lipase